MKYHFEWFDKIGANMTKITIEYEDSNKITKVINTNDKELKKLAEDDELPF